MKIYIKMTLNQIMMKKLKIINYKLNFKLTVLLKIKNYF